MDGIISKIDIINICDEPDDVSDMCMSMCVRDGRDDGYLINSKHSNRFDEEDCNNQTDCNAYLRVEERTSSERNNDQMILNCFDGEKFDSHIAAESLRVYERKLQLEKKEAKAQEREKILFRLEQGQIPGHMKRYEHLYEYGKTKIISKKESACPKTPSIMPPNHKLNGQSIALNETCNRLYNKSVTMQLDGKNRRNQIDKARAIANPLPISNRRGRSQSPCTARTKKFASEASTAQEVIDRLYAPSKQKQEDGKEHRTRSASGSFNSRDICSQSSSRASKSTDISSKGDKSPMSQEIVDRLYAPSISMQEYGKERREEISALGSFNSREARSQSSSRASKSTDISSKGDNSPVFQGIVDRLYAPSISMQEYGKERREGISKMRTQ